VRLRALNTALGLQSQKSLIKIKPPATIIGFLGLPPPPPVSMRPSSTDQWYIHEELAFCRSSIRSDLFGSPQPDLDECVALFDVDVTRTRRPLRTERCHGSAVSATCVSRLTEFSRQSSSDASSVACWPSDPAVSVATLKKVTISHWCTEILLPKVKNNLDSNL